MYCDARLPPPLQIFIQCVHLDYRYSYGIFFDEKVIFTAENYFFTITIKTKKKNLTTFISVDELKMIEHYANEIDSKGINKNYT